jgi:hypothetical protein
MITNVSAEGKFYLRAKGMASRNVGRSPYPIVIKSLREKCRRREGRYDFFVLRQAVGVGLPVSALRIATKFGGRY